MKILLLRTYCHIGEQVEFRGNKISIIRGILNKLDSATQWISFLQLQMNMLVRCREGKKTFVEVFYSYRDA